MWKKIWSFHQIFFLKYLMALILNYYYNASNFSPFGASRSPSAPKVNMEPKCYGMAPQDFSCTNWSEPGASFSFQILGKSSGCGAMITRQNASSDFSMGWLKMGERIWTSWFIKFIHSRAYFNYGKTEGPDSQQVDGILLIPSS